jgi:hypothetical protein
MVDKSSFLPFSASQNYVQQSAHILLPFLIHFSPPHQHKGAPIVRAGEWRIQQFEFGLAQGWAI